MSSLKAPRLYFQTSWYVVIAGMLLMLPLKFVFCWLLSAAIHEWAHLACMRCLGVDVLDITVGADGAKISTTEMKPGTEALCAFAGPASGLALLLFMRKFPLLAICAAVQTFFNLLPLYPMDGGRVFYYILSRIKNPRASRVIRMFVEHIVLATMTIAGVFALGIGLGPVPVLCVILFLIRNRKIKIPCKAAKQIVQ